MHFNFPSIDPGVMAFVWAVLLAAYVYFGLLAVGASGAFAVVIAGLCFAGIWLFVRLRGEDETGR
jgi:fatty acid desaturase